MPVESTIIGAKSLSVGRHLVGDVLASQLDCSEVHPLTEVSRETEDKIFRLNLASDVEGWWIRFKGGLVPGTVWGQAVMVKSCMWDNKDWGGFLLFLLLRSVCACHEWQLALHWRESPRSNGWGSAYPVQICPSWHCQVLLFLLFLFLLLLLV